MPDVPDISPELLALLACPSCDERPGLEFVPDSRCLSCSRCGRNFDISADGIPLLSVPEEAPAESDSQP